MKVTASIFAIAKVHLQKGMNLSLVKGLVFVLVMVSGISFKVNAQCSINTPPTICTGGSFLYTATTSVSSPTFKWEIINNNTGATMVGVPTANQATINHGNSPGTYTIRVEVLSGSTVVETCTNEINVSAATSISIQPSSISSNLGCSVSFSVTASGTEPLNYQWQKNNADIPGANNSSLSLSNLIASDAANYKVIVSNGCSSVISNIVTLSFNAPLNPGAHNTDVVTSCLGVNPVELNFSSANGYTAPSGGSPPYSFQWKLNGTNISGATEEFYNPDPPPAIGTYSYNVEITDACGNMVSTSAKVVQVVPDPTMTVTGPSTVCLNGTINLTANITGGT